MKRLIILVGIFNIVSSKSLIAEEITNNNGYAVIKYDKVNIVNKYNSVLHIINLTKINELLIKTTKNWLEQKTLIVKSPEDIAKTIYIDNELNLIQEELKSIKGHKPHIRKPRSLINIGGRVLNFLFRTTYDDEDTIEIESRLKTLTSNNHELIMNTNRQVDINNHFQQEIDIVKKIIDIKIKNNSGLVKEFKQLEKRIIILEYIRTVDKVKAIIEKIQNIILASRLQIMTESLLTAEEIDYYEIDLFKLKNIKLSVSEYDKDLLIFIIQIPDKIHNVDKYFRTSISNEKNMELDIEENIL